MPAGNVAPKVPRVDSTKRSATAEAFFQVITPARRVPPVASGSRRTRGQEMDPDCTTAQLKKVRHYLLCP